jgi:hypothetical protein
MSRLQFFFAERTEQYDEWQSTAEQKKKMKNNKTRIKSIYSCFRRLCNIISASYAIYFWGEHIALEGKVNRFAFALLRRSFFVQLVCIRIMKSSSFFFFWSADLNRH